MIRSLRRRLDAVAISQALVVAAGCDTCRLYAGIVLVDDDGNLSRPEICPDCGRDVPIFHTHPPCWCATGAAVNTSME